MRVALAQVNPTVGAIEANARLVIDWMERARRLGADIVAFPELALTGYPPEDLLFKPAFIEANLRALADVAAHSRGLTAVLGFVDKRDDIFNAAAVLHDGVHVGTYHKQYLPNYGVFDENRYFQAGTESPVFALGRRWSPSTSARTSGIRRGRRRDRPWPGRSWSSPSTPRRFTPARPSSGRRCSPRARPTTSCAWPS